MAKSCCYFSVGLVPAKSHKVTIEARKLTGKGEEGLKPEQLSATTEFMTAAGGKFGFPLYHSKIITVKFLY